MSKVATGKGYELELPKVYVEMKKEAERTIDWWQTGLKRGKCGIC